MNSTADWLFNVMFWGAIVTLLVLLINAFVAPILGLATALIGLVFIVVVAAFWPHW